MDERTIAILKKHLPNFSPKAMLSESGTWESLDIPAAEGADYYFVLYEDKEDAQRDFAAKLVNGESENKFFWGYPLEESAFDSPDDLRNEYCRILELILTRESQIVQKKGTFFWSYICSIRGEDKWTRLHGVSGLRIGVGQAPPIEGKEKVYRSPKLSTVSE